jgi:hypothetical protein
LKSVHIKGTLASIPMRCLTRKRCHGVLSLGALYDSARASAPELARVDLNIPARTELVLDITLSRSGLAYVRAHHRVPSGLTAVYEDNKGNIQGSETFKVTIFG